MIVPHVFAIRLTISPCIIRGVVGESHDTSNIDGIYIGRLIKGEAVLPIAIVINLLKNEPRLLDGFFVDQRLHLASVVEYQLTLLNSLISVKSCNLLRDVATCDKKLEFLRFDFFVAKTFTLIRVTLSSKLSTRTFFIAFFTLATQMNVMTNTKTTAKSVTEGAVSDASTIVCTRSFMITGFVTNKLLNLLIIFGLSYHIIDSLIVNKLIEKTYIWYVNINDWSWVVDQRELLASCTRV